MASAAPSDEKLLVRRAQRGDRAAFRELVERYQERAFHLANEIMRSAADAEDVVQESFVKAYLSLPRFKAESSFYTWLYRIVVNLSIDAKRKRARRGGDPLEFTEPRYDGESGVLGGELLSQVKRPDEQLLASERARKVREAMDELSDDHRTVLQLREFDGLSYDEIAESTGVSKGTVMSRLHYARKRLQTELRKYLNSEREETSTALSRGESAGAPIGEPAGITAEKGLESEHKQAGEVRKPLASETR